LTDRASYETWVTKGAKDFRTRAKEKASQMLTSYQPAPLDQTISKKLDQILEKAKKELGL
jgi:trimethylamine:corrinoid methyltransferase-like protein